MVVGNGVERLVEHERRRVYPGMREYVAVSQQRCVGVVGDPNIHRCAGLALQRSAAPQVSAFVLLYQ